MGKTIGILSDFHSVDPRVIAVAIKQLVEAEADALVLNGDIFGEKCPFVLGGAISSQDYVANLLTIAGQSGLPTFISRGSHETVPVFEPVVAQFAGRYPNLIDAIKCPKVEVDGVDLVFLPGSNTHAGEARRQGYDLQTNNKTGFYRRNGNGEVCSVINMNDLGKLVSNPDKTIVFTHVPRRFDFPNAVDMAESGHVINDFSCDGHNFNTGSIVTKDCAQYLAEQGYPIALKKQNAGSHELQQLYEMLGITKAVNCHIHEAAGIAHDAMGSPVESGVYVPSLFYNASCMERGIIGMLSFSDNKAAYENLNITQ